jgi:hypothetical protein
MPSRLTLIISETTEGNSVNFGIGSLHYQLWNWLNFGSYESNINSNLHETNVSIIKPTDINK